MESGQHEEYLNSSSEETDQQEQTKDDTGTRRSYECVFCKRGFTTAQALGGHMNIHRKDRARTRPTSSPSKPQDDYASHRFQYPPVPSHVPHYAAAFEYQMYFPASTSVTRAPQHPYHTNEYFPVRNPQLNFNPFREDWPTSLSLHIIPNHAEDTEKKRQGSSEEEEELDLELRLGHDP